MLAITGAIAALLVAQAAAPAAPKPPPPRVSGAAAAPPPAWVETARGDRWLAFSSFCWRTTCVDFIPPELRPELPRLTVRRGETVRFHLGFSPHTLTLTIGTKTVRLTPSRVAAWRVARAGILVLNARGAGGNASYAARVRLS